MSSDPLVLRKCIQKVATGPEYSKDLSYDEAYSAMRLALAGDGDPVQIAVLLIALRMKRETAAENAGVLQAILDTTRRATSSVPDLIDIADPYNGQTRGLPMAPFLPPVLAACGLPAVSHGVRTVGPKFGVTHHLVLAAAGVPVSRTVGDVAAMLAEPGIGWGYVDQREFNPALHELVSLRERIVKRPVLTTVEVLANPLRGTGATHFMTGYVHKAYPPVYTALAQQAGFDTTILVRGVEGGVIPSLQQPARLFTAGATGEATQSIVDPAEIGIDPAHRCVSLPDDLPDSPPADEIAAPIDIAAAARAAAEQGLAALNGARGAARDSLVYAGAIALRGAGRCEELKSAAYEVARALDDGRALARFKSAI